MRRISLLFVATLLALPLRAQWTALGDMPQPSRQGDALRFQNTQAIAVVTALSPEVIRVRVAQNEGRDHSYAVINRSLGDAGATFSVEPLRTTLRTGALQVTVQHAPFRIAFAARNGQSLDEDDAQRGTAMS